ncbi:MAG: hypothetical protein IKH92_00615 [Clostridiales bacterium]|nr:hypothetical protein [Clostridiales bacterium]
MKKLLSCALVLTMLFSMAGCAKKGGYKSSEKKMISALEAVFDAEEMSAKTKKKVKKSRMKDFEEYFDGSSYVIFNEEDFEDIDADEDDMGMDPENMKNMLMFRKFEGESSFASLLIETTDKDAAEECFEYVTKSMNLKTLKKQLKKAKADYGIEEDDNKIALIYVSNSKVMGLFFEVNGTTVTMIEYEGNEDTDLLEEYYDFMREIGYTDMEALLDGGEEDDD